MQVFAKVVYGMCRGRIVINSPVMYKCLAKQNRTPLYYEVDGHKILKTQGAMDHR